MEGRKIEEGRDGYSEREDGARGQGREGGKGWRGWEGLGNRARDVLGELNNRQTHRRDRFYTLKPGGNKKWEVG